MSVTIEELQLEAQLRYLNDAYFHARVRHVLNTVFYDVHPTPNDRSLATLSACVALVVAERRMGPGGGLL